MEIPFVVSATAKRKGELVNQTAKIDKMRAIFNGCLDIAEKKGHDYAGQESALSNFKDFGWQGVVVRLSDKYHRLKNFCKQGELKVSDESIRDTFKDMINYACLGLLLFDEEHFGVQKASEVADRLPSYDDLDAISMKTVYIAGPYSAPTTEEVRANVARAEAQGKELLLAGYVPVIPHKITGHWEQDPAFFDWEHSDWLEFFFFPLLKRCDAIYLCDGWQCSKGAAAEFRFAAQNNIPVAFHLGDLSAILGGV